MSAIKGRTSVGLVAALFCAVGCGGGSEEIDTGVIVGADAATPGRDGSAPPRDGGEAADSQIDDGAVADVDAGPPEPNLDQDEDGVPDDQDAFPDNANEWLDSDMNGLGNYAQTDEDGDGVLDTEDAFPFDVLRTTVTASVSSEDPSQTKAELTGVGPVPFESQGRFESQDDKDGFIFEARGGTVLGISWLAPPSASVLVTNGGAAPIAFAFLPSERPNTVGFWVPADASYTIEIYANGSVGDYTLFVFEDADLDGASDDREVALGGYPDRSDTDEDGVNDGVELVAPMDPDGDGVPSWLDDDSDGDGILDFLEGAADPDGDGIPSLFDLDSDGNGVTDAAELSASGLPLLDSDVDGDDDFRDPDDDGDGLLDANDSAPLTPIEPASAFDPAQQIFIERVEGDVPGMTALEGAVMAGAPLTLRGFGFSTTPGDQVLLESERGTTSVPAVPVSTSELRAVFPEPAIGFVSVVKAGRRSESVPVTVLAADAPILFPFPSVWLNPDDFNTYRIEGQNLDGVTRAEVGGMNVSVGVDINGIHSLSLQAFHPAGFVRLYRGSTPSNAVEVRPARQIWSNFVIPSGATFSGNQLELSTDSSQPVTPGSQPWLPVQVGRATIVSAMHPTGDAGAPVLVLQAVSASTLSEVYLSSRSTAVAMVAQANGFLWRIAPESMEMALQQIEALSEVATLGDAIESGLAGSISYLAAPDAAFAIAFGPALEASETYVTNALAAGTLQSHAVGAQGVITPPSQYDVAVRQIPDTGNIEIENDTSVLLSAAIRDGANRVLVEHVDSFFHPNVVGGQRGILGLFAAAKQEFKAPNYRNATVEVVTPGVMTPLPSRTRAIEARTLLQLRTMLDKIIMPLLVEIVGKAFPSRVLLNVLMQQNWDAVPTG